MRVNAAALIAGLSISIGASACIDPRDGVPLGPAGDLVIVAHEDDDLLFMQPDLYERVTQHVPTTVVYITAGDAHLGVANADSRIEGVKAAYAVTSGVPDWHCGWIDLTGHAVEHCRLWGANLSLVFVGYPDGFPDGSTEGSLLHLWEGTARRAETVADIPASYSRDELIAAVTEIVAVTQPQTIHTLEIAATHGGDHSDHMMVGTLAMLSALRAGSTAALLSYRGYNAADEAVNMPDDLYASASLLMRGYQACVTSCDGTCGVSPCSTLTNTGYEDYLHHRYAVAMRQAPVGGTLRSDGGCIVDGGNGALALGACGDALPIALEPGGLVEVGAGCVEVQPDYSLAVGPCIQSPARAFALDDEGHLWSALAAPPQPQMDVMHALCVVGETDLHVDVCGADLDARWDLLRPASESRMPKAAMSPHLGRAIRMADMTGDSFADLCTVGPRGLVCAMGDGEGNFGSSTPIGSGAGFEIEPQSLALGDVDGDGAADACGRDENGIACLLSSTGFQPVRWSSLFASSGPPTASDRSLAIVQGMVCGTSDDGIVCVRGDVESDLTGWASAFGAPAWPADLDGDTAPDWCAATPDGVQCGLAAEQTLTGSGTGWGFSLHDVVESSVAADGSLDDTIHAGIADISGDGRGDMCVALGSDVRCAVSQSHGFGPRRFELELPSGQPIVGLWLGDIDGDGKADACAGDGSAIACAISP